jgi:hypothetical protein
MRGLFLLFLLVVVSNCVLAKELVPKELQG